MPETLQQFREAIITIFWDGALFKQNTSDALVFKYFGRTQGIRCLVDVVVSVAGARGFLFNEKQSKNEEDLSMELSDLMNCKHVMKFHVMLGYIYILYMIDTVYVGLSPQDAIVAHESLGWDPRA